MVRKHATHLDPLKCHLGDRVEGRPLGGGDAQVLVGLVHRTPRVLLRPPRLVTQDLSHEELEAVLVVTLVPAGRHHVSAGAARVEGGLVGDWVNHATWHDERGRAFEQGFT